MSAIGEGGGDAGFTLFEMLVVLAILGLIGGLIYPAIGRAAKAQRFAAAAAAVTGALGEGRARALRSGLAVRIEPAALRLPETMRVATLPVRGLTFFPDGSSSGGAVTLTDDVRRVTFRIAPASGRLQAAAG